MDGQHARSGTRAAPIPASVAYAVTKLRTSARSSRVNAISAGEVAGAGSAPSHESTVGGAR